MRTGRTLRHAFAAGSVLLLATTAVWSHDDEVRSAYAVKSLVSDGGVPADHVDASLVNPWGIAFNPTGLVWVSNNGTATSTLYDGAGVKSTLTVTTPAGARGAGGPTGIVFSGSNDFQVRSPTVAAASRFIFASTNGVISGWAPSVNGTNAILAYDAPDGAVYTGLAIAANGNGNFLFATDFRNNKIDVLDRTFVKVIPSGNFVDNRLPSGYAPFGIQAIQGNLYVMYAKQDINTGRHVAGQGLGFVTVFDSNGNFIRRVASRGRLNAPWGIALAPADFGRFSNRLLVANFGDGTINAYDAANGDYVGRLRTDDGRVIKVDGLWGLSFGNGMSLQHTNALFFTAGPNGGASGQYGRIEAVSAKASHRWNDDKDD